MTDETTKFALFKPRWSGVTRFLRRMAVGLAGVAVLLWFVVRVDRVNSERGMESSRATGLSASYGASFNAPLLAKRNFLQVAAAQAGAVNEGRQIARTASLRIAVQNLFTARESLNRIVNAHAGFVGSMNLSYPKESARSLSAQVEIPQAQSGAALEAFRSLGRVELESESSEDVTPQSLDLDARLRNTRTAEEQLADILRMRTTKVSDVLEVEQEQARVRVEIESMEAQQKRLNRRVVLTSIDLNLFEDFQAELGIRNSLSGLRVRNALVEGLQGAADGFTTVVLVLLSAGPSLILWAVILFWPGRWAWRRWRASRTQNAAAA